MLPSRARRTNSASSTGALSGALTGSSLEPSLLPEAGSVIVAMLKSGTGSQTVGLPGEIFRKSGQARMVRRFRQRLQARARLPQILMDDFQRFSECLVLAQQFEHPGHGLR